MKKIKLVPGIVLLFFAAIAVNAQQNLPVVAVAPFERASGISAADVEVITEVFFIQLGNQRNVLRLVDRGRIEHILREHNFQTGDWSNQNKTARLNEALNADWIVLGNFRNLNNKIIVTIRLLDIRTFEHRGGTYIELNNAGEAYSKIDPLVASLVQTISGSGGSRPDGTGVKSGPVPENFIRIEGGTFTMGSHTSEAGRDGDESQHMVTISSFYMGKNPVTQAEYEEIMGANPSNWKGFNLPVEQVSWFDAVEYCNRRSAREGLTPAYTINGTSVTWNRNANGYRLPTEAEWEFACRAGTTTPFNTGFNITTNQANYDGNYPYANNAKGTYRGRTTPVGSFPPNQWGLYDMHGNVWEWCWDWYGEYSVAPQTDPAGAVAGANRVLRGGCWYNYGRHLRSATRGYNAPSNRHFYIGFRLVRSVF